MEELQPKVEGNISKLPLPKSRNNKYQVVKALRTQLPRKPKSFWEGALKYPENNDLVLLQGNNNPSRIINWPWKKEWKIILPT